MVGGGGIPQQKPTSKLLKTQCAHNCWQQHRWTTNNGNNGHTNNTKCSNMMCRNVFAPKAATAKDLEMLPSCPASVVLRKRKEAMGQRPLLGRLARQLFSVKSSRSSMEACQTVFSSRTKAAWERNGSWKIAS